MTLLLALKSVYPLQSKMDFVPPTDHEKGLIADLKLKFQEHEEQISHEFRDTAILRFVRGRKHDVDKAFRAMLRHVEWRKENDVENITEESIQTELNSNKLIVSG